MCVCVLLLSVSSHSCFMLASVVFFFLFYESSVDLSQVFHIAMCSFLWFTSVLVYVYIPRYEISFYAGFIYKPTAWAWRSGIVGFWCQHVCMLALCWFFKYFTNFVFLLYQKFCHSSFFLCWNIHLNVFILFCLFYMDVVRVNMSVGLSQSLRAVCLIIAHIFCKLVDLDYNVKVWISCIWSCQLCTIYINLILTLFTMLSIGQEHNVSLWTLSAQNRCIL